MLKKYKWISSDKEFENFIEKYSNYSNDEDEEKLVTMFKILSLQIFC